MVISIVIPIYNVERYIGKCLSSIYCQDLKEDLFEVIAVNDGTPDNSMDIVKRFSTNHGNLRIIEKENEGVSSARNEGIKAANGKYVTFVDADDWLELGSLNKIYHYLCEHPSLETLICHSFSEYGKERYPWEGICLNEIEYTGVEIYERGFRRGSVCGGVYERSFLLDNNIFFPIGVRNGEDSIFFNILLAYVNKISFLDISFYVVYERLGSSSRVLKIEHLKQMAHSLECAYQLMLKHSVKKNLVQCDILIEMVYMQISMLTYTAIGVGNFSLRQILGCIDVKKYLPIHFQLVNRKGWKLRLLNLSYPLFYYLVKLKLCLPCFNH